MQIIITDLGWLLLLMLTPALAMLLALILLAKPILRYVMNRVTDDVTTKLFSDNYVQNLAELLPSFKRFSVLNYVEMSLRAQSGKILKRPLGTAKHFLGFENLMFAPRQMTRLSLPESTKIDMSVTLGPNAEKPLTISIPLMISGMAYGLALSEESRRALARAAKTLQTATCSGNGPFLPEEREEAGKYILQITHWPWGGRTSEQLAAADMLEVHVSQGATVGPERVEATAIEGRARVLAGLAPGQPAISLPAPPGIEKPGDWPAFMENLREKADGIPIALKLMATDRLEEDLSVAVDLGFDAVVIDSAEGASHAASPLKEDDFGIPSLNALIRARRYLGDRPISLIVAGGYFTPGQCLKALTLGADAIYLGTVPLFALVHNQLAKATPFEPPTMMVYYDSPIKTQLNVVQAATSVANTLTSMVLEMEEAMRALGKASLKELNPHDLVALDSFTAEVTGVKRVF